MKKLQTFLITNFKLFVSCKLQETRAAFWKWIGGGGSLDVPRYQQTRIKLYPPSAQSHHEVVTTLDIVKTERQGIGKLCERHVSSVHNI